MDFQAPTPYRFNPWKHHLQWVISHIEQTITSSNNQFHQEIITNITSINSNHVDIYTGQLQSEKIIQTIDLELHNLQAFTKTDFQAWLSKKEYQLLTLSDCSVWVIREGIADDRYIHFHPARNSANVIRVHGNTWKTAIALKLLYPSQSNFTLDEINQTRKRYLNLSPIKDLKINFRLQDTFERLQNY